MVTVLIDAVQSFSPERAHWGRHKRVCNETTTSWKGVVAMTAVDRVSKSGRAISIPMANIKPLLQEFVESYRALLNMTMFNAFGWTAPHLPHTSCGPKCFCDARQESKVLFITLQAVPKLSLATKGRAAFLVKDAEALTIPAFREASENRNHRLYHPGNMAHLDTFDHDTEEGDRPRMRASMCFIKLLLESSVVTKDFRTSDDPLNDYSSRWNPDDWLQHLKQEVAKGKGWEPPYDPLPPPISPQRRLLSGLEG
ncbi:hypothetical protein FIBSPDRAFT_888676 [Athelia psychrophila]|uniref:Uncharacterized protein n=1 Tax=Athelia psychrophila TaxID=1759441 RepID=A0A166N1I6_9AGAM|nr:hypothetical protein FIBSPDRAFT_888676 [Fibularhizoctonia sp. CBS 109695]